MELICQEGQHNVYFLDNTGRLIGTPLRVAHNEPAPPPEYEPQSGRIFLCWSRKTDRIIEDTYAVAVTRPEEPLEFCSVTYFDAAGLVLDMKLVLAGEDAPLPAYAPPEGYRCLGWEIRSEDGEEPQLLPAEESALRGVTGDCCLYARCEAEACRLYALDLREETRPGLQFLGSYGFGAIVSQEDLFCLHLRSTRCLHPFRLTLQSDAILALTPQGVRAFDLSMRPIEMNAIWLMPDYDAEQARAQSAPAQIVTYRNRQLMRKEA
ncbi:MAG: hypothetical protein LBG83_08150 [Oscillospiraceae bacterium]|jgi:hypothetical protein|nr:hypothetical protein [Oscillospiraceae bacterium]